VQSPVNTLNPNARVCSLINQDTRWWDVPLVRLIFSPEEADAICGMPLSFLRKPEFLIWNGTKHGSFTVRSAYYLELARRARDRGESSRSQEVSGVSSSLWSLQALGVLKHFVLKVCNNAIPTKDNLYRRKILQDPLCPICANQVETVWHILWDCPASVDVWQECHRKISKLSLVKSDGLGWVQQLMAKLDSNVLLEALSVARCIWLRRNGAVFRQGFADPRQIVTQGREVVCFFVEAGKQQVQHGGARSFGF
jgi:hypothetical protein